MRKWCGSNISKFFFFSLLFSPDSLEQARRQRGREVAGGGRRGRERRPARWRWRERRRGGVRRDGELGGGDVRTRRVLDLGACRRRVARSPRQPSLPPSPTRPTPPSSLRAPATAAPERPFPAAAAHPPSSPLAPRTPMGYRPRRC